MKLETALREVPGVGLTRSELLQKLRLITVADLFLNRPRRYEDRARPKSITQLVAGEDALVRGTITAHGTNRFRKGTKSVYEFILEDGTGRLHCRFWNLPFLEKHFRVGMELFVFGRTSQGKPPVMDHPEFEVSSGDDDPAVHLNRIVPVYRLTEGIPQRWLRGLVWRLLANVELPETSDEQLVTAAQGETRGAAMRELHFPSSLEAAARARIRFALEEFVSLQRGFAERRRLFRARAKGNPCAGNNALIRPFLKELGFKLTAAQTRVLREIRADLGLAQPMRRLLHGDVGSGKTVVAACAALMAIESGYQVALMTPTEVLADQHFRRLDQWWRQLHVPVHLLTGRAGAQADRHQPGLTIGTHALIHDRFQPARLGLVIIDEQHRFGVVQRDRLVRKGDYPHLLVMTATPIPRTLGLTAYGDLDVSVLDELPPRRGSIRTHLRASSELPAIWTFVREQLAAGRQAYVVCPRINEDGAAEEHKSAIAAHDRLRELLTPHRVGLLHGRMAATERERVMSQFAAGKLAALVATTIIEVGVDVANANVMVVENAGQFGLSQLHQLRGRIGRGDAEAHCILVEDSRKAETLERLKVLLKTTDGFQIAEADLQLRGAGDFLGVRQSGLPKLKFGDLQHDRALIELAAQLVRDHPRGTPSPMAVTGR